MQPEKPRASCRSRSERRSAYVDPKRWPASQVAAPASAHRTARETMTKPPDETGREHRRRDPLDLSIVHRKPEREISSRSTRCILNSREADSVSQAVFCTKVYWRARDTRCERFVAGRFRQIVKRRVIFYKLDRSMHAEVGRHSAGVASTIQRARPPNLPAAISRFRRHLSGRIAR